MTSGVVAERTSRRDNVANEISPRLGRSAVDRGPVLTVPYRYSWIDANGHKQIDSDDDHYVLPETLEIDGRSKRR